MDPIFITKEDSSPFSFPHEIEEVGLCLRIHFGGPLRYSIVPSKWISNPGKLGLFRGQLTERKLVSTLFFTRVHVCTSLCVRLSRVDVLDEGIKCLVDIG